MQDLPSMKSSCPQTDGIKPASIHEMMTTTCQHQKFACINHSYAEFDKICASELRDPITASQILNESDFCVQIPINNSLKLDELETSDFLKDLKYKVGLYHIWIDYDACTEHNMHTLLCVYVGKGLAGGRIKKHIREKYSQLETLDTVFCTFYECSNRIAKYLEQLFLDLYSFESNKNENLGANHLFGVWDEGRHLHGTQLDSLADTISAKHELGSYSFLLLNNGDD